MVSKLSPFCRCPPVMNVQPLPSGSPAAPAVLLHQFIGDFVARERVADDQGQAVFRREFALVARGKAPVVPLLV